MPAPAKPRQPRAGHGKAKRAPRPQAAAGKAKSSSSSGSPDVSLERNPKGVPAPAAALMQSMGLLSTPANADGSGDHGAGLVTSSLSCDSARSMEVEVETTQGYVYTGKLVHLDARYNLVLHEALVRRARDFDVERAELRLKAQREARLLASSLQDRGFAPSSAAEEGHVDTAAELMPRPRYVGTAYLRSNNVFMVRFVDTAAVAAAADTALGRLQASFARMAAAIKAHLQQEKMRNRTARRKRLEAKKSATAAVPAAAATAAAGTKRK